MLQTKSDRLDYGKTREKRLDQLLKRDGYIVHEANDNMSFELAGIDRRIITPSGEIQLADYKATANVVLLTYDFAKRKVAPANPFSNKCLTTHIYVYNDNMGNYRCYEVDEYRKKNFGTLAYARQIIDEFESFRDNYMSPAAFETLGKEFVKEFQSRLPSYSYPRLEPKSDTISLMIL
jgi:hypothetical protein